MDILDTFNTLLSEHGKLEAILESSFNGILEMDGKGYIEACNPAAKKILHLPHSERGTAHIVDVLPLPDLPEILARLQNRDEIFQLDRQIPIRIGKRQEVKFLEMKFVSIPKDNDHHLVLIVTDKSDVLRALENRETYIATLIQLIDELKIDNREIIYNLAKLVEIRDVGTGKHLERVEAYTRLLGYEYQKHYRDSDHRITDDYVEDMALSSVLHDIGKIGITDSILQKPGKLEEHEFELIKEHTLIAGSALSKHIGKKDFLAMGREISLNHHEKWDGTGYPNGKKGEQIPLSARIVSLCDVYDALTSERSYKEAFSHDASVGIILQERGKAFEPGIVDIFMNIHEDFRKVRSRHED